MKRPSHVPRMCVQQQLSALHSRPCPRPELNSICRGKVRLRPSPRQECLFLRQSPSFSLHVSLLLSSRLGARGCTTLFAVLFRCHARATMHDIMHRRVQGRRGLKCSGNLIYEHLFLLNCGHSRLRREKVILDRSKAANFEIKNSPVRGHFS